jgi:adenosine deaminase
MDAVNRARQWGEEALGVRMAVIMDIPREVTPSEGDRIAAWAVERYGDGIIALGLGGPEIDNPPGKFRAAFDRVRTAGMPCILHAGETVGPESIREAIEVAGTRRIGHGVRAAEDEALMHLLRERRIPLEICPTSNVCLGIFPSLEFHPFQRFLEYGLVVTLNSDDPAMFNTTLTGEFIKGQKTWNWNRDTIRRLVMTAVDASLLSSDIREEMKDAFKAQFSSLVADHPGRVK